MLITSKLGGEDVYVSRDTGRVSVGVSHLLGGCVRSGSRQSGPVPSVR